MEKINAEKLYKIVVDEQSGADGMADVTVGINGRMYQIARGHEVVVSGSVVLALKDAIYTRYKYDGKGKITEYSVPRFPVRVLGEAQNKDRIINKAKIKNDE